MSSGARGIRAAVFAAITLGFATMACAPATHEDQGAARTESKEVPDPPLRRDTVNVLPDAARAFLDSTFSRWRLADVRAREWLWPQPPMSPAFIWGDFDGDGTGDVAAQLLVRTADDEERRTFAFLDRGDSVEALLLFPHGSDRDALYLIPAGEETFDSTAAAGRGAWRRAARDEIGVVRGDSAESYEIVEEDE